MKAAPRGRFCKRRLEDILKELVPLALVRSIKSVQPPKAVVAPRFAPAVQIRADGSPGVGRRHRAPHRRLVASATVGTGQTAAQTAQAVDAQQANDATEWLGDMLANQRLLARQPRHLQVPATQPEEISTWLTTSVGVAFRVPDLVAEYGPSRRTRVTPAGNRPVGQLIYTSNDGDLATIAFRKDNQPGRCRGFLAKTIRDEIGLCHLAQCR